MRNIICALFFFLALRAGLSAFSSTVTMSLPALAGPEIITPPAVDFICTAQSGFVSSTSPVVLGMICKNTGNSAIKFSLGTVGQPFKAIWHDPKIAPGASQFKINDEVAAIETESTDSEFIADGETSLNAGHSVKPGGKRALYILFDVQPEATSVTPVQINITAFGNP